MGMIAQKFVAAIRREEENYGKVPDYIFDYWSQDAVISAVLQKIENPFDLLSYKTTRIVRNIQRDFWDNGHHWNLGIYNARKAGNSSSPISRK